jgi:hypothetical protein
MTTKNTSQVLSARNADSRLVAELGLGLKIKRIINDFVSLYTKASTILYFSNFVYISFY